MLDRLQRPLRDLRLSVTDRCNFRCGYCMPKEVFGRGYDFLSKDRILSFEELARISRIFVGLGVEKIRLTGGEPTMRRDIERLVAQLAAIDGLRDLTLTTNGSLLVEKAAALRSAGLRRLTVSLDSIRETTFAAMNDVNFPLSRVLAGIDAALAAGFSPIKLNMVVKRGVNETEVAEMARRFAGPDFIVRFIEYMDVGNSNGWRMADVVPASEIISRVGAEMPLTPLPRNYPGETSLRYRLPNGGEIGVIASVTRPFCGDCTRARLTADGTLFTCLFASHGIGLLDVLRAGASDAELRAGASDAELREKISAAWKNRDDRYSEIRSSQTERAPKVEMSRVGG
jgi:cyclic pyranopterin phosphate synthase